MDIFDVISRDICLRQPIVFSMVALIFVLGDLVLYKHRTKEVINLWQDLALTPIRWLKYAKAAISTTSN